MIMSSSPHKLPKDAKEPPCLQQLLHPDTLCETEQHQQSNRVALFHTVYLDAATVEGMVPLLHLWTTCAVSCS
jgi:hypothetical protein